jgi:hypothetical protein
MVASSCEIEREAQYRFNIDQEAPIRLLFAKIGPNRAVLAATFHHIAIDLVSIQIFFEEVASDYRALSDGIHSLSNVEIGFRPTSEIFHASRGTEREATDRLKQRADMLGRALSSSPMFPTDFDRPDMPSFVGNVTRRQIDQDTTARIDAFARAHNSTMNIAMLAALLPMLSRVTKASSTVIGIPVTSRNADSRRSIGCYVNLVPFIVEVGGCKSADLLKAARDSFLHALDFRDLEFDDLLKELPQDLRSLSTNPISVIFAFFSAGKPLKWGHEGTAEIAVHRPANTAKYEITFEVHHNRGQLSIVVEYATELFRSETIEAMISEYVSEIQQLAPPQG